MFRAQRNFYLTGFCMIQLLVISRIYQLLKQVNKLEATQMALKKQAEGAAAAYKAVAQEKEAAAKKAEDEALHAVRKQLLVERYKKKTGKHGEQIYEQGVASAREWDAQATARVQARAQTQVQEATVA